MSRPRKIQDELQGRQDQDKEVRCLLPKRTRKEQRSQVFEEDVERIFWEAMQENNWKPEDFAAEETKEELSVFSSIEVVHCENVKPGKIHLMNQVQGLQNRVNNLSIQKRKTSFARFKVKQQNIFGLAFIDTEI